MLEIGNKIPDITLPDENGINVRLKDYIGKKPLIIYFYPKDETPGCIREACSFRDSFDEFQQLGALVIGISNDSVKSHFLFKKKYRLNFTLLSDKSRIAERSFKVKRNLLGLLPGRVTFGVDLKGIVRFCFDSALNPKKHVKESLSFLMELKNRSHE